MKKDIFKNIISDSINKVYLDVKPRSLKLLDINKVHIITGVRRSGKSHFMYQTINELRNKVSKEKIFYISFEDDRLFPLKLDDLRWIIEAYYELFPENRKQTVYAFFDEVQEVELWEKFIRRIYDTENIKIYISGSTSKMFFTDLDTSLRGRTITYKLFPLSFKEYLEFSSVGSDYYNSDNRALILDAFNKYMISGGFPEIVATAPTIQKRVLKEYLDLTVYKDIIERHGITNREVMKYLVSIIFRNTSTLLSINKLYNDLRSMGIRVAKNTLYDYLGFLEDANLVLQIPVFSHSVKDQQRNPKKTYIIDNGYHTLVSIKLDKSKLFENLVFLHLKREFEKIFYYKGKQEVDFCYYDNDDRLNLINVAYDISEASTYRREISGLTEAMKQLNVTESTIVTLEAEKEVEIDGLIIKIIPLWKWLVKGVTT